MFTTKTNAAINATKQAAQQAAPSFALESLEGRQLMSGTPLTVTTVPVAGGQELLITGSNNGDNILVSKSGSNLVVANGAWSTTVAQPYGGFRDIKVLGGTGNDRIAIAANIATKALLYGGDGNDTLVGGAGDDQLYGGAGSNSLDGGAGNDALVTLGGSRDTLVGGAGLDGFWMPSGTGDVVVDATAAEKHDGAIHWISNFAGQASGGNSTKALSRAARRRGATAAQPAPALGATTLGDPATTESDIVYANFAGGRLFSDAGPSENDINQGYVGDCYFLSTLSAVAKVNADVIRQTVCDLGDGTFAVRFANGNNAPVYVRVNADLPVWSGSNSLAYAQKGAQGSLWVSVIEKAFAQFRNDATPGAGGSYAAIEGGWMGEAASAIGLPSNSIWSESSASQLMIDLAKALSAGKAVTFAVGNVPAGAPVIGEHAYTVDHIGRDAAGNAVLVLRNPWGVDGAGNDGQNDGYVTLTPAQALGAFWGMTAASV